MSGCGFVGEKLSPASSRIFLIFRILIVFSDRTTQNNHKRCLQTLRVMTLYLFAFSINGKEFGYLVVVSVVTTWCMWWARHRRCSGHDMNDVVTTLSV